MHVPLLNFRGRHATQTRLLAILAGADVTPHVATCDTCGRRLAELRAWADAVATASGELADETFTSERLATQKAAIMRRLEAASRPARLLSFPAGAAPRGPAQPRRVAGWIAAAAAAGLVVGIVGERVVEDHPGQSGAADVTPTLSSVVSTAGGASTDLDEAALLDAAYDRVSIDSLRAIDDMTPRVREIALAAGPR